MQMREARLESAELVSVTVVCRHGARFPNWSELSPFKDVEESQVVAQWGMTGNSFDTEADKKKADNNLSEVGRSQMYAVGKIVKECYPEVCSSSQCVEWHSSTAGRCVESGKLFWQGTGREEVPSVEDNYDRDLVFKAWDMKNTPYKQSIDALKHGTNVDFVAEAEHYSTDLETLWSKLGVHQKENPSLRYYWSSYGHCLLECEKYFFGSDSGVMTKALTAEERSLLSELACTVWERRFHASGFARFIGGGLLELGARRKPDLKFRFMSCHDYSILSLLAAAGEKKYEDHLAFGAFLVIEHYDNGVDIWRLSPRPFAEKERKNPRNLPARTPLHDQALLKLGPVLNEIRKQHRARSFDRDQEALVLMDFSRALRLLATRAPAPFYTTGLNAFANIIDALTSSGSPSVQQSRASLTYTSYLLRFAALESYCRAVAVLMAHFWLFSELSASYNGDWVAMYRSAQFQEYAFWSRAFYETTARSVAIDDKERAIMLLDFNACAVNGTVLFFSLSSAMSLDDSVLSKDAAAKTELILKLSNFSSQ